MKLIDKDKIAAEIERRISLFKKEKKTEKWSAGASQMNVVSLGARIAMLEEIFSYLDTLEVKEVDLDEEFDKYCDNLYLIDLENEPYAELFECAKHFFELGMAVSNKTQKGE